MTEKEFWDHIRATRRVDADEHAERLTKRLAKLPAEECLDFDYWWRVMKSRSYRRDLWGAAYLINGGCSDDGFEYFCGWLILQGRAVFEAALADPDTLAEVLDGEEDVEFESYPGSDAWFAVTGTEPDDDGFTAFERALRFRHPKEPPLPKLAPRWDFDDDDEVRKRFPRLAAMYLGDSGGED
jgi:hypothetical protein